MTGMKSNKERSEEAEKLMSWGFREFNNYKIFEAGQTIAEVPVWFGTQPTVTLKIGKDVVKTLPRNKADETKLVAVYKKPLPAPITKGEQLGVVKSKSREWKRRKFRFMPLKILPNRAFSAG